MKKLFAVLLPLLVLTLSRYFKKWKEAGNFVIQMPLGGTILSSKFPSS